MINSNCRLCKNPGCVMRGSDYTPNPAIECFGYEPMSRADQLRAMTDEELARAIARKITGCYGCRATNEMECMECVLEELKQEAACNAETKTTISDSGGDATDRTGDSQVDV